MPHVHGSPRALPAATLALASLFAIDAIASMPDRPSTRRRAAPVEAEPLPDLSAYHVLTVTDLQPGPAVQRPGQLEVAGRLADDVAAAIEDERFLGLSVRRGAPLGVEGEIVLEGTVVRVRRGSRAARYFVGPFARARLVADLELRDGLTGDELAAGRVKKLWAWPGIAGATRGMNNLLRGAGGDVVAYLRETRSAESIAAAAVGQ